MVGSTGSGAVDGLGWGAGHMFLGAYSTVLMFSDKIYRGRMDTAVVTFADSAAVSPEMSACDFRNSVAQTKNKKEMFIWRRRRTRSYLAGE